MEFRWLLDNALNFTPHVVVLALALAGFAIFGRQWPLATLGLVLAVVGSGYIARSDVLLVHANECGTAQRLTVATFNVQSGKADLEAFARFAEDRGIEVIVLEEMNDAAFRRADALYERYPYRTSSIPRWIEVISSVPLESVESHGVFGETEARRIWSARVLEPFGADLYFFHGQTARTAALNAVRIRQYELIETLLGDTSKPAIVVGDMNATVLSPGFAGLLRATGLRSAADGRRDSATWPVLAGPLGIRIDHVLERGFEVCSVERGPSFGSDHRPLVVQLAVVAAE